MKDTQGAVYTIEDAETGEKKDVYITLNEELTSIVGDKINEANMLPLTLVTALGLNPADNPQVKDALAALRGLSDYSTAEKWTGAYWINDKKLYKKTVNLGALPAASSELAKPLGINNIDTIVDAKVLMNSTTTTMPIPYTDPTATGATTGWYISTATAGGIMVIKAGAVSRAGYTGLAVIYYTCTDR